MNRPAAGWTQTAFTSGTPASSSAFQRKPARMRHECRLSPLEGRSSGKPQRIGSRPGKTAVTRAPASGRVQEKPGGDGAGVQFVAARGAQQGKAAEDRTARVIAGVHADPRRDPI